MSRSTESRSTQGDNHEGHRERENGLPPILIREITQNGHHHKRSHSYHLQKITGLLTYTNKDIKCCKYLKNQEGFHSPCLNRGEMDQWSW